MTDKLYPLAKRSLDVCGSSIGLLLLLPFLPFIALAVKLSSRGPVFYRQQRMGIAFTDFTIYKFRTMQVAPGLSITVGRDHRITSVGHFLRKYKLDELPQLFNVLRGDMSLVGPRPEVRKYVDMYRTEYAEILSLRPGVTDLASVNFIDEASLLANSTDPEKEYVERILPRKIEMARAYSSHASLRSDLAIIWRTVFRIVRSRKNRAV